MNALVSRHLTFRSTGCMAWRCWRFWSGYFGGIVQVWSGIYPTGIIAMGFVSNLGAFVVMLITGRASQTPASAAFFGLIALGLAALLQPAIRFHDAALVVP